MVHDADTRYDCFAPHFSQVELVEVLGEKTDNINDWIKYGYLKPDDYVLGPRRTPLRRYSIVGITRASIIASCINHAGLRPKLAAEIAKFCDPIISEHFERDIFGECVSQVVRLVISQIQRDGKLQSWACYRRRNEHHFYLDDPELNPKAQGVVFPIDGACITVPLTDMFNHVFRAAVAVLKKQDRGALEYWPSLVWADEARTRLAGLTREETKEFRLMTRTAEHAQQNRHNKRYWELYEKYDAAAEKVEFRKALTDV